MNSEATGYEPEYSDEQLAYVEQLAGIGFSPRKIAITIGIATRQRRQFVEDMETEGTLLNNFYLKGQFKVEAEARLNVTKSAKSSIMAFQEMRKTMLETDIDELKRNLEPGYTSGQETETHLKIQYKDNLENYNALKEYVASGETSNLPAHLQDYWNKLSTAHDMISNFQNRAKGRKYVAKLLQLKYQEMAERTAYRMINEAINFFNIDIDKNHWRNILCESLDKVIAVAWKMNRMDWIIKAIREQSQIQGLHLPEPDPIPEDLLNQKVLIITSNAKEFGYDPVPRKDLMEKIRAYEISKNEKKRLARDAGITDIEFEE